jgi:hypothetical protein
LKVLAKRYAQGKCTHPKPRLKITSPKSIIEYDLITKSDKKRQRFHTIITNVLQKKPYCAKLAKNIVKAAKETSGVEKK